MISALRHRLFDRVERETTERDEEDRDRLYGIVSAMFGDKAPRSTGKLVMWHVDPVALRLLAAKLEAEGYKAKMKVWKRILVITSKPA